MPVLRSIMPTGPMMPQINPGPMEAQPPMMPQFNQFSFQNPYMYGAGPGITPPFRINATNQPIAGQQNFQAGIAAAQPQQGLTPELQQVLDIIRQNQNYAGQQGTSQAQALAARRGLAGSSIEQFGVQQAGEAASRAAQEQTASVLLANVQRQQALQDLQTRGYFERAGQEASLGAQLGTSEAQLTSDEIASIRNIQLANQQLALQRSLGEQGIAAQMGNIQAQRDIAADEQRNALIGTGASLLAPYALGGLFGAPGGGGGGLLSGLFGGGGGGAAGASSSLFPGGVAAGPSMYGGGLGLGGGAGVTGGALLGGAGLGLAGGLAGNSVFGGGNDLGAYAGGGLGFLMGGPLGAGVGSFLGTGLQRAGESVYQGAQKAVGNTAASLIKPFVDPVGSVKKVGKKAEKAIKSVFPF